MTRKKEIPALRNEERGLFYLGLLKVDRLESELVTYSNLDYVVVMIPVVCNLSYTDVVTSIEYDVLVLVRETYRDREVYGLNVFCIILVYQETWLQTCLESKTSYWVVVQSDRHIDVAWILLATFKSHTGNFYILSLEALYRVESTYSNT